MTNCKQLTLVLFLFVFGCQSVWISDGEQLSKKLDPIVSKKDSESQFSMIKLNIYIDLETRQTLVMEKTLGHASLALPIVSSPSELSPHVLGLGLLKSLEQELNQIYEPLQIRFVFNSTHAWESSDNGRELSLDHLAHILRSKVKSGWYSKAGGSLFSEMNIGIISSPSPSFASLSDLVWSRSSVPVVIIRRPLNYYQQDVKSTLTASARLLVRGIAMALNLAPVCDGGWGGSTKDQLLGFKAFRFSPQVPQHERSHESLRGFGQGQEIDQNHSADQQRWSFSGLTWSQDSRALLEIQKSKKDEWLQSCHRFKSLKRSCTPLTQSGKKQKRQLTELFKQSGEICMTQESSLIDLYQEGSLKGSLWQDYLQTAKGLTALASQNFQEAFDICQTTANHHPSLLASKCAGLAADKLGKHDHTILYLRAYLSSHPNDIDSLAKLAKALGIKGLDQEALAILEQLSQRPVEELGQKKNQIFFNLGVAQARLGMIQSAHRAWLKLDPTSEEFNEAKQIMKSFDSDSK